LKSIYLDNNSTTRIFDEVVEEMAACLRQGLVNPASQHRAGREARRILADAREEIGTLLGANSRAPQQDRVVFTSGGTESNNLAIHGLVSGPGNVVISQIEHPSVIEPAERLESMGYELRRVPVSRTGHVEVDRLADFVDDDTRLVCVMYANNELGTLQPVRQIAELCGRLGVPVHCDAVQAVGKTPIDFRELGVSTLSYSAHKFHGPRGAGGLVVRHDVSLRPFMLGGSQQLGTRPGTESIASVLGSLRAMMVMLTGETESWTDRVKPLRDRLEQKILAASNAVVIGTEPRMPHTTNLAFPGLDRQALVMALDLAGVECSTGSACTSGSSEPSHVVLATGVEESLVRGSIRLSLSTQLSPSDIELAADRILRVVNGLQPSN
jgi:cysteine desulfurase